MKSSVSFEAARRALTEAKAHAKSKAAAVLQTSNKAWQEKLAAAKDEKQQLLQQLDELKQQGDQLQQQVWYHVTVMVCRHSIVKTWLWCECMLASFISHEWLARVGVSLPCPWMPQHWMGHWLTAVSATARNVSLSTSLLFAAKLVACPAVPVGSCMRPV